MQLTDHNLIYLLNALLFLTGLLGITWVVFHRRIKTVANWLFLTLPTFCFLLNTAVIFNLLLPFNKIGALIFSGVIFLISLCLFGKNKLWPMAKSLLHQINGWVLLGYAVLFLSLAVFLNLAVFQNNVVGTTAQVAVDFYNHNQIIYEAKTQSGLIFNSYPKSLHVVVAYLDAILPGFFVTPTEYVFIFMAIFMTAIVARIFCNNDKKKASWELIPLIFIPSFLILCLHDYYPAAIALIPIFLIYDFVAGKLLTTNDLKLKKIEWFYLTNLGLSLVLIYHFIAVFVVIAMVLGFLILSAINIIKAPAKFYSWLGKNSSLMTVVICLVAISIVAGSVLVNSNRNYFEYILFDCGGMCFPWKFSALNLFGVMEFRFPYYRSDPNWMWGGILVAIFWTLLGINRVMSALKISSKCLVFFLTNIILFTFIFNISGSNYLALRYYAVALVLIMVFCINAGRHGQSKLGYRVIMFPLTVLVTLFFIRMALYNPIAIRNSKVEIAKLDYSDVSVITNHLGKDDVLLMAHSFIKAWNLRLFTVGDLTDKNLNLETSHITSIGPNPNADISVIDLSSGDYLLTSYRYSSNYPKLFLEKIYQNQENDVVLFKILTIAKSQIEPWSLLEVKGFAAYPTIDEVGQVASTPYVMAGYFIKSEEKNEKSEWKTAYECDFYGKLDELRLIAQQNQESFRLNYIFQINETNFNESLARNYCQGGLTNF